MSPSIIEIHKISLFNFFHYTHLIKQSNYCERIEIIVLSRLNGGYLCDKEQLVSS